VLDTFNIIAKLINSCQQKKYATFWSHKSFHHYTSLLKQLYTFHINEEKK